MGGLALHFLVAVVNSFSTKTHSSKETTELCFKYADVKSICCCKERVKINRKEKRDRQTNRGGGGGGGWGGREKERERET